ncbi:MAG: rane protein, superfamily [Deltaproteobacteria bacterium]|nr:rane protein, superfamily [Deltaproteobacteria bacterium]
MYRKVIAPVIACALLALLAWMVYTISSPFLTAIGWGTTIAVVTFPAYGRMRRWLGGRPVPAAILMVLGIFILLVGPAVTLMADLSRQAADIYPKLEELATRDNPLQPVEETLASYESHPILGRPAKWIRTSLPAPENFRATLSEAMKKVIGSVTGMLTAALSNLLAFLFNLILTLAALGIFYVRGEFLCEELAALLPFPADRARDLLSRLGTVMKAVVKGVGLTCIAQGTLGGLGFLATGLPSPLLFGTVMAFGSLIPVVGTAIVWLPGALYLLFTGKTVAGIGLILWGAFVVGGIDNILRPLLIGGNIGIPLPLLIVGIIGGLFSFGLSGLVLGPLALAALLFVLEEYHRAVSVAEEPPPASG